MQPQTTVCDPDVVRTVFGNDDICVLIGGHLMGVSDVSSFRGINWVCDQLVKDTGALRNKLFLGPTKDFLDISTWSPNARTEALCNVEYSPFLKVFSTTAFSYHDALRGMPNPFGAAVFKLLPTALDAYHNHKSSLEKMLLCRPAMKSIEMVTFVFGADKRKRTKTIIIRNERGVTLYDVFATWVAHTKMEVERGAPICLSSPWAPQISRSSSQGEAMMKTITWSMRGCLAHLRHKDVPMSEMTDSEHFCRWDQNEELLKYWTQMTCVEGEKWFAADADRKEQGQKIEDLEQVVAQFRADKKAEIKEKSLTGPMWLKICLERKRAKSAGTVVFNDEPLIRKILKLVPTTQLLNLWRVNQNTSKLFNRSVDLRTRLFLDCDAQQISCTPMPPVPAGSYVDQRPRSTHIYFPRTMSAQDKAVLLRKLKLNPLCGKLVMDDLIKNSASIVHGVAGLHKLCTPLIHAIHRADGRRGSDTSASGMFLTDPPVSEVYLHVAVVEPFMVPGSKLTHEWRVGYHTLDGRTCLVQGTRTEHVVNEDGVTIGDVVKAFMSATRTSPKQQSGLPLCISILGDPADGAMLLRKELREVVQDIAVARAFIAKEPEHAQVYMGAMTNMDWRLCSSLKQRQFAYYTNLLGS